MASPDLNLLIALDALLAESSVARASRRLRLSPSATSRALARLRDLTGDPLLVRAGRGLVATPYGAGLREQAHQLLEQTQAILRPSARSDPATLERTFTLRTSDGFVENFGPALLARIEKEAPGVRLNFLQKPDKQSAPMREGLVDLETGVIEPSTGPEIRAQALFRDRLVGVVRRGHPLAAGKLTADRYRGARHVIVSRTGFDEHAVDRPFLPQGLSRQVACAVGGFAAALALARGSDLVAIVPERHTEALRTDMSSFALPMPTRGFTVSMLWHPRLDADPAHRWLRVHVREVCAER
ncbi:MAG TPA: LysR family transcriptional regulator [Phenylobacterium sp.]